MVEANAIVQTADRTLEMQQFELPESLDPGQAILEVEGCGICGTDWALYQGELVYDSPFIPGHEPVGRIHRIGPEAEERWGVSAGDRVAVGSSVHCGHCEFCTAGKPHICENKFYYGVNGIEQVGPLRGGFSEYMLLHPDTMPFRVPESLSVNEAVLFNPLGNSIGWVDRAEVGLGDSVLILGPGQRGLGCTIACNEVGADDIIVTGLEKDDRKLQLAREFGATETIVVDDTDVVEAVERTLGEEQVDVVIDTTPNAFEPITTAVEVVKPGGTIALTGHKDHEAVPIVVDDIITKDVTVKGLIVEGPWADRQALRLIAEGNYPIEKMHTHTFPLADAETALQTLGGETADHPIHITVVPE